MTVPSASDSLRQRLGHRLRVDRTVAFLEVLAVLILFALQVLGLFTGIILIVFLLGWISLWLRGDGWRGVGLRRPDSWTRAVAAGGLLGLAWQLFSTGVFLPLLQALTGQSVDLSELALLRGNLLYLLAYLLIGWVVGGFIEEMTLRGYLLNRITTLFRPSRAAWVVSAILTALLFGAAHAYQGLGGVLENSLFGLLLGFLYLRSERNLWPVIIAHGTVNTIGVSLIYLGYLP